MRERQIVVKTLKQREKFSMPKSIDLTNINSIMENLLGKYGKIHEEKVTTEVTEEDDLIREDKFIKELRKRKRSASDLHSEARLALKIVKASTLLNDYIPKTSFTVSEKTAKVAENRKIREQNHISIINCKLLIRINQVQSYCTLSPELDIQMASPTPDTDY